jgi:hypothetical protein
LLTNNLKLTQVKLGMLKKWIKPLKNSNATIVDRKRNYFVILETGASAILCKKKSTNSF